MDRATSIPNCPTDNATPNFLILDGTSNCGAPFTSRVSDPYGCRKYLYSHNYPGAVGQRVCFL